MEPPREDIGAKLKLFISHQWRDKQVADRLARDLEAYAEVWMDFRNLRPGDPIQDTIDDAIKDVDLVLVVWTEHAQRSKGVQAEIQTGLNLGVRLVPCIFAYDEGGNPLPPLREPLDQLLGLDFHHYGSGMAQLATLILQLEAERLPAAAVDERPGMRMLEYLRGYLSYLANYRDLQGVPDQRAEWVDKIIAEIERYVEGGGDRGSVAMLLEVARRSDVDDREGIGALVTRLERLLGEAPANANVGVTAEQPPGAWRRPPAPPADLLARRVATVVPAGTTDAWLAQVGAYLDSAAGTLQALAAYALATGSQAGAQVVLYLQDYLDRADDLVPDHLGRYGLLDDAWLIINTAFRLVESGLVPASAVPVDWTAIAPADYVVRAVIPEEALAALSQAVLEMLQVIADEVSAYQPWFTPQGSGYTPTMAAPASVGGCWEDQMSELLRGTGLSVYD